MFNSLEGFWEASAIYGAEKNERKKNRSPKGAFSPYNHPPVEFGEKETRIRAFLRKYGPARSVDRGGRRTLSLANSLLIGYECSRDETFMWMMEWNQTCDPPWNVDELWHKIDDAPTLGGVPGYLLNAEYTPRKSAEDMLLDSIHLVHVWPSCKIDCPPGGSPATVVYLSRLPEPLPDLSDIVAAELPPRDTVEDLDGPAHTHTCDFCSSPFKVYMTDPYAGEGAVFKLPCRKFDCEWCRARTINHWGETIRHHLGRLTTHQGGGGAEPVYLFTISRDREETIKAYLRAHSADYFRIDHLATGDLPGWSLTFVSTVRPAHVDASPMTPEAAVSYLLKLIENLPAGRRGSRWSSSRAWKLLSDGIKRDPKWFFRNRLTTSDEAHERVLGYHDIRPRNVHKNGRFWGWRALVFSLGGVPWDHLGNDLDEGQGSPVGAEYTFGSKPTMTPDEWATAPTTSPPGETPFVVAF